jgi:hypothetical protein
MRHRSRALFLLFGVVLVAACSLRAGGPTPTVVPAPAGGSDASSPTGPTSSPPAAVISPEATASRSPAQIEAAVDPRQDGFAVGLGEWAVEPEAREVRPGNITFVVRNGGALAHEFEIEGEEGSAGEEFELEGPEFGPGETVRLSAPLVTPQPTTAGAVQIRGFAYGPDSIKVPAGTEVTWRNAGGAFGSDALANGETFTTRLRDAGIYAYFCAIHPTMKGTIEVT